MPERVESDYPAYLRRQGIEGTVVAECALTPDGTLEDIKIFSSSSAELSELAIKVFGKWCYKPAFCKDWGKPIRVYITMTTTFALHGKLKE
jgi:TonB family protein